MPILRQFCHSLPIPKPQVCSLTPRSPHRSEVSALHHSELSNWQFQHDVTPKFQHDVTDPYQTCTKTCSDSWSKICQLANDSWVSLNSWLHSGWVRHNQISKTPYLLCCKWKWRSITKWPLPDWELLWESVDWEVIPGWGRLSRSLFFGRTFNPGFLGWVNMHQTFFAIS